MRNEAINGHSVNSSLYKFYTLQPKVDVPELYSIIHEKGKKVEVSIHNYSKTVPNNIFQASYIQYELECSLGWKVSRRFNDFFWLRKCLYKTYPGCPIPPVPEKKTYRSFDGNHIHYRM